MSESEELLAFTSSMPESYLDTYDAEERAEHARIVARRGSSTVHIERWRDLPEGGALICVVADDRPGLLSFICSALVRRRLEVRVAQIYSRRRDDDVIEAVDFFWLRAMRQGGVTRAIEERDLERVATSLADLLEAPPELSPRAVDEDASSGIFDPTPNPRVFFNTKALRRGEYVLVVEVPDYAGLLLAITSALHSQGVEIGSSDIRTEDKLARDCFLIRDTSGQGLGPERLAAIRKAVVTSVRAGFQAARRAPPPESRPKVSD